MSYENPITETYRFPASATLSTAGVAGRFIGPAGKTGRVLAASAIVTTGVTVAAGSITVGPVADPAENLSFSVPISAANSGHVATKAQLLAGVNLERDTVIQVAGGGEATAGAADITITVGWF